MAPAGHCQRVRSPAASYNVQVTARWKGKDRIVIEGSAHLPGARHRQLLDLPGWPGDRLPGLGAQPTFQDGKISAESKLVESQAGPLFDPNAHFEVVLSVLGEPVQVPYFTISVPVEGKPE